MKAIEAVRAIAEAIWRPGVEVRAVEAWMPGTVDVEIIFDTYDSSVYTPDGKYTLRRKIAPIFTLPTDRLTRDQLLYKVLKKIGEAQEHEDREFLRVRQGEKWVAPFHPHNRDGNDLWAAEGGYAPPRYGDGARVDLVAELLRQFQASLPPEGRKP